MVFSYRDTKPSRGPPSPKRLRQVKAGPHHAHLEDLRDVAGRMFGISAITGIPTVGSADVF